MAIVKPVLSVQNKVVADELDFGVVRLSGLDVDVGEGKVVARAVLGAVHPEDSVVECVSGKVVHVNVVPFKVSLSWVVEIGEIGETERGSQNWIQYNRAPDLRGVHDNWVHDVLHVDVLDGDVSGVAVTTATTVGWQAVAFADPGLEVDSLVSGALIGLVQVHVLHYYVLDDVGLAISSAAEQGHSQFPRIDR